MGYFCENAKYKWFKHDNLVKTRRKKRLENETRIIPNKQHTQSEEKGVLCTIIATGKVEIE